MDLVLVVAWLKGNPYFQFSTFAVTLYMHFATEEAHLVANRAQPDPLRVGPRMHIESVPVVLEAQQQPPRALFQGERKLGRSGMADGIREALLRDPIDRHAHRMRGLGIQRADRKRSLESLGDS